MAPLTSFTKLTVWQKGHSFVLDVYRVTEKFPGSENFGLKSQLRRAAISITSNIAEGFERGSSRELQQFLAVARGSLAESQNQLLIARDLGYIGSYQFGKIADNTVELHKLLGGFIKSVRTKALTKD